MDACCEDGERWADFEFPLAGEYNVLECHGGGGYGCGMRNPERADCGCAQDFKSVKRRLEVRAQVNGITIIDDFAHHPTAIAGTLKALRARYPGARLWAILEPRSNTLRRNVFQNELAQQPGAWRMKWWLRMYSSRKHSGERAHGCVCARALKCKGGPARADCCRRGGIVQTVAPEMRPGDVVAILSNGGFGGIYEKLPQRLKSVARRHFGRTILKASAKA